LNRHDSEAASTLLWFHPRRGGETKLPTRGEGLLPLGEGDDESSGVVTAEYMDRGREYEYENDC